jgi:chromosome segregation ATPase
MIHPAGSFYSSKAQLFLGEVFWHRKAPISRYGINPKTLAALAPADGPLRYQPNPFCVLDEVDAPLDEANIGRLMRLLREMSSTTQFIIITHSKKTMESAQAMHGVTMQEPRISRRVSGNSIQTRR